MLTTEQRSTLPGFEQKPKEDSETEPSFRQESRGAPQKEEKSQRRRAYPFGVACQDKSKRRLDDNKRITFTW